MEAHVGPHELAELLLGTSWKPRTSEEDIALRVARARPSTLAPLRRRVRDETGCSIVIIEHDMALISSLCDELVALERGAVIARGAPADVLAHERVLESYLGTDAAVGPRRAPASSP